MDTFDNTKEYLDLIEKYKMIAENIVECIWLFDLANKRFKYISPSIFNLRGLTVEEAMNEKLEDCLTPESLEKIKSQGISRLPQFLAGDRSENVASNIDIYDQYCKDGTIKKIEISTKLIINKETNSVDVLGVSRDLSHRRNLNTEIDNKLEDSSDKVHKLLGIDEGRIYCFGKLLVYGNSSNSPIKWRTSKSKELFAYLLQNIDTAIPKWKICEALWPECNSEKINNHLHTSIYNIKKALTSAHINFNLKFINGCYSMSLRGVCIDIEEFDSIVSSDIIINEDTVEKYEKSFSLYKNDYLEGFDYAWALSQRESYSVKYYKLSTSLVNYYMEMNNYTNADEILQKILNKDPLDEFAHEMRLKLYLINNNRVEFIKHYNALKELFKSELGIEPNKSIQALYDSITSN